MRHFFFTPAALGIAAALLAQRSAPADKPKDPAADLCTVTGHVVTASEGNPLKSARIGLVAEDPKSHDSMYAASSDSDGHFTLKDVPPGRYQFFASRAGFVEQHYKAGSSGGRGPLFSLKPGEKIGDVLFRLVAASVITGRISNVDGEPMQNIQVVALRRPTEEETEDEDEPVERKLQVEVVGAAESDDRGQYRIFGLKSGEYFVRPEDTAQPPNGIAVDQSFWIKQTLGSDLGSMYFPGVAQLSQAQVVPVKAGEDAQADITMRRIKTVDVAGRVVGGSGPMDRTEVRLEPENAGQSDFYRDNASDDKGNFRFRNVPEGTYYVVAYQRDPGSRAYESRARLKVEVGEDNLDALTVSLNAGATIQGRVKVDGSSSIALDRLNLALSPTDENGYIGAFTEVKKDGTFELKSVGDGSYAIRVWGLEDDNYVKSARRGPDDLFEKGVQVEGGASGRIELTVSSESAKLEGSVADDDGPVIGARVRLVPDPLTPYNHLRIQRTNTDQLGQFSLKDIAPGKYKITARRMIASDEAGDKSELQAITLSDREQKKIQIELKKPQQP
jgi:hypothetical protein